MSTLLIVWIVFAHWIADFVLQSHNMAVNKSSSNKWLGLHVATYTAALAVLFFPFFAMDAVVFAVVNGVLHVCVDYNTSRWSSKHFGGDWHKFFVIIGFDQMLHMFCLFVTAAAIL